MRMVHLATVSRTTRGERLVNITILETLKETLKIINLTKKNANFYTV